MQIPCVYLPGPAPAVSVANSHGGSSWSCGAHYLALEAHPTASYSIGHPGAIKAHPGAIEACTSSIEAHPVAT